MKRRAAAALLAACAVLLSGCTPPAPDPTGLQVVLAPHPDDDLLALAVVDPADYTVWVIATLGEATGMCEPDRVRRSTIDLGEWPSPDPAGRYSAECTDARVRSWLGFHRDYSIHLHGDDLGAGEDGLPELRHATLPVLDGREPPANDNPVAHAGEASVLYHVGERAALVAFDGGDGDLQPDEVEYMVDWVLQERGATLPDLPLHQVVGASYYNDPAGATTFDACVPELCSGDDAWAEYPHADHLAVNLALARTDFGAARGNVVTTWPRTDVPTVELAVAEDDYCFLMCTGTEDGAPDPGLMQTWYGWLAFPGDWWPPTERTVPNDDGKPLIMSRQQVFLTYFGDEGAAGR